MYYIINRTTNQTTTHYGNFPDVDDLLNRGDDVIIISLYSNTIKVPYKEYDDNWGWKDYNASFLSPDTDYPWDDYNDKINQEYDEQDYNEPEISTEYVIASTSQMMEETMVFPSNADGHITDYTDLNCVALRYGRYDWEDAFSAVAELNTDEYKYIYVRTLESDKNIHNLFRRIDTSDAVVI